MQVVPSFDPSVASSGNIQVNAADAGCKVLLYNLSIFAIQLNFEDGSTGILHPGEANWWMLEDPTPTLEWSQYDRLNISSPAISIVTVQLYRQDEEIEGTYPTFFGYQFNIGNTVSVSQGNVLTIQNDGNPSGTTVYESTVSGSPGSNVVMQNQGLIEVLQWIGGVLTQIFKTDPGAASVVKLANTGLLAEVLGNLKVDGTTELVGNLTADGTASFNSAGATIDNTSSFNGNAVNTNSVNTATVNCTTVNGGSGGVNVNNGGNVAVTGNVVENNNKAMQWKDSSGTARNVLNVDGSNNVNLQGITGKDVIQFLKSDGTLEALIDLVKGCINLSTPSTVTNGGTNGTATMYMPFQGSALKLVIINEVNFQTGASNQDVSLPTSFANGAYFWTGSVCSWSFLKAGVVQQANIVTALASGGGTSVFQGTMGSYMFGNIPPNEPFDAIRHLSGAGSQHTGFIILLGN